MFEVKLMVGRNCVARVSFDELQEVFLFVSDRVGSFESVVIRPLLTVIDRSKSKEI